MNRWKKYFYGFIAGTGLWHIAQSQSTPAHLQNAFPSSGAYSRDFTDVFSFEENPACLAAQKKVSVGFLAERKWMLKELDQYTMAATVPAANGGVGLALHRSGDEYYHEQSAELAYGKSLGRAELGIQFGYFGSGSPGYQMTAFASAGLGIRYRISAILTAGWEMTFPVFASAGKLYPENGPQVFHMGLGYQPGSGVLISCYAEKHSGGPLSITAAVDYIYSDQFFFSFGMHGPAGAPFFKSGWKKNQLCIQAYILYDMPLGFTPGIVFLWTKQKDKR